MINKKYVIGFFSFFLFSCFNSNANQSSNSDFLAYYNTFYAAETSFNEAIEMIDSSNDSDKIPEQAKLLLEQSMQNSLIIENKFSNSQYLDDAYYILGRSSYLMNKVTASNYYFSRLINEFPSSKYNNEAKIWLGYLNLKIGNVLESKKSLLMLDKANDSEKRLLHLLSYEIYLHQGDFEFAEKSLIDAIEYSKKEQKLNIYNKLLIISEENGYSAKCIKYLDLIEETQSIENLDHILADKWMKYNIEAKNYKKSLDGLDKLISVAVKKDHLAKYIIEKAKINILMDDISLAKNSLIDFIDDNIDNRILKTKISEAYLILGEINLEHEFNFDGAKENFQSCSEISPTSAAGKKANAYLDSMDQYLVLIDEVKFSGSFDGVEIENNAEDDFLIPLPDNYSFVKMDSLYYNIARLLYFDLSVEDSAVFRFKNIVNEFPLSPYSYKSMVVLNIAEPDSGWNDKIDENQNLLNIFNDVFNTDLQNKRNNAWELLSESYDKSMNLFVELSEDFDDHLSLYAAGYISDFMYNDISNAVKYYNEYILNFPESEKIYEVKARLVEIKEILTNEIDNINQRKNYRIAQYWLNNDINVDSTVYYLDNSSKVGLNRSLKSYCQSLISSLEEYRSNLEIYTGNIEQNELDIDFIQLKIADFLYKEIDYDKLALDYYMNIIENSENTGYVKSSLASLIYIEPDKKWDSLLYSQVRDSAEYSVLLNNSLKKERYKVVGTQVTDSLDFLWYQDLFDNYFAEEEQDSTENNIQINEESENIKKEKKINR